MFGFQGMICLAANQVWWTWEVEDVFKKVKKGGKTAMKDYAKKLHKQLNDVVIQVFFFYIFETKPKYVYSMLPELYYLFFLSIDFLSISERFDLRFRKTTERNSTRSLLLMFTLAISVSF